MKTPKPTLIITRGLPASGKTTWAKTWVAESPTSRARVNRDDLRAMLFDTPDYSHAQETAVTTAARQAVKALLNAGRDVIADDTNLRPRYVREWARFANGNGAELEVIEFPITIDEAIERDARREKSVGEDVIRRMVTKYLPGGNLLPIPDDAYDFTPEEADRYEPKPGATPAILVDIDGTLALHNGRSPYDLTRCGDDLPNQAVIEAVRAAYDAGLDVVYLSGREDVARDDTKAWLDRHVGIPGPLHMRAATDKRKDSIVKRELFDQHVRDTYDVRYVLDDRNQVVAMWRSLGLTVFQVADGAF